MTARRHSWSLQQPLQPRQALLAIPVGLILVITVVDLLIPVDIHLDPLLVTAPAITASFAGARETAAIGALAVAAQAGIGIYFGTLFFRDMMVPLLALAMLSALIVFFCVVRERHGRELAQVRSVAETAQHVLLRPLPDRIGRLELACLYLAAADEAQIGGDLYAATRIDGGARVMIGDVRGKGLAAVGEAALLLGAFRESAHRQATLPVLAAGLEHSVSRYLRDYEPERESGERFVTTLLLEIPDDDHIALMTSCGHPPPLLLSRGEVGTVTIRPSPPLGVTRTDPADYTVDTCSFVPGDTLLLYTDGVIEARDAAGVFYPFTERVTQWAGHGPEALIQCVRRDLLAHAEGRLGDDAALVAIRHTSGPRQ